jgi:hypothetical protein
MICYVFTIQSFGILNIGLVLLLVQGTIYKWQFTMVLVQEKEKVCIMI